MLAQIVNSRNIFLLGLMGVLFGMPITGVVVSLGQMLLAAHWLLTANFKTKWDRIKTNKAVLALWAFYGLHVIGLIHSQDVGHALDDLRIKLPLLLLPLYLVSQPVLKRFEFNILMAMFCLGAAISGGIALYQLNLNADILNYDVRSATVLVPHIRYSLMLDICIVWLLTILLDSSHRSLKYLLVIPVALFFYILFKIQAITGLVILPIALLIGFGFKQGLSPILKNYRKIILLCTLIIIGYFSVESYVLSKPFLNYKVPDYTKLEMYAKSGKPYLHQPENMMIENGNPVWFYIVDEEAKEQWNKRSKYDFNGLGKTNQAIRATLYRYLTSKGIRKDSAGVKSLSNAEIQLIENGETNAKYAHENSIEKRLYETIWELNNYFRNAGSYDGHSVAQRFEFWKVGMSCFADSPLIGHGTGDIFLVMNDKYEELGSNLSENRRYKPHNQYITSGVTLGLLGTLLLVFCFVLVLPMARDNILSLAFLVIICLSMLTEDTIEGQIGATLFSVFYALFFCQNKDQ